jgi:hypothetical protein
VIYRDLTTLEEYAQVVALERRIWGPGYDDVVPVPILAVSVLRGGILIGAFTRETGRLAAEPMVGFVYSLPGIKHGKATQWSHMLGVVAEHRKRWHRPPLEAAAARARAGDGPRADRVDLRPDAGAERAPQLRQARRGRRRVRRKRLRHLVEPVAQRKSDRSVRCGMVDRETARRATVAGRRRGVDAAER